MITVSLYRAYRVLISMTIVVVVSAAITLVQAVGHVHAERAQHYTIPLSYIVVAAGFIGILTASIVAGTLSRERQYLAMAWTRPENRFRGALIAIAIDFGVIILCDVIAFVVIVGSMQILGNAQLLRVDGTDVLASTVLSIGIAYMWYGLVAACTAPFARTALVFAGYPVFFVLFFLDASHAGRIVGLDGLIHLLDRLNPLAYIDSAGIVERGYGVSIATVFAFAIVGSLIAVAGWSRREATR